MFFKFCNVIVALLTKLLEAGVRIEGYLIQASVDVHCNEVTRIIRKKEK
jgi:hypothetical protein